MKPESRHVRLPRLVRAELVELVTLAPTAWALIAIPLLAITATLVTLGFGAPPDAVNAAAGLSSAAVMVLPAALLIAWLVGATSAGDEYRFTTIQRKLGATPSRWPWLAAKLLAASLSAFVAGAAAATSGALVAYALLTLHGIDPVFDGVSLRAMIGAGIGTALVSAMGVAAGILFRSAAASALVGVVVLLLVPGAVAVLEPLLSAPIARTISGLFPAAAAHDLMSTGTAFDAWSPLAVLVAWAFLPAALAFVTILNRDTTAATRSHRRVRSKGQRAPKDISRGTGQRSFARTFRAETYKVLSSRSAAFLVGLSTLAIIGTGVWQATGFTPTDLAASASAEAPNIDFLTSSETTLRITAGISIAQVLLAIFGALAIADEFTHGSIRSSVVAVGRRWQLVVAKALVVTLAVGVSSAGALFATRIAIMPIQKANGFAPRLSDPAATSAVIGGAAYLVLVSLVGFSLGLLIRNSVVVVVVIGGLLLALPPLVAYGVTAHVPDEISASLWNVSTLLPGNGWSYVYLGGPPLRQPAFLETQSDGRLILSQAQSALVLVAWAAVLGTVALLTFTRRRIA